MYKRNHRLFGKEKFAYTNDWLLTFNDCVLCCFRDKMGTDKSCVRSVLCEIYRNYVKVCPDVGGNEGKQKSSI